MSDMGEAVRDERDESLVLGYVDETLQPVGTRVRHMHRPELTGTIKAIERQPDGSPSAMPYNVAWDDESAAREALGWFWIYPAPESLERLS